MASLKEIREKLANQKNNNNSKRDNGLYPFWNQPLGTTSTIRFLPDGDSKNDFFWVERIMINLPFQGIVGKSDELVRVAVPCMHMYKKRDFILDETKAWWDDAQLKEKAKSYWKKPNYILQGFVVNSKLKEEEVPENPIRRFSLNKDILDFIHLFINDVRNDYSPVDYDNGSDFQISKSQKGQYAKYMGTWERPRALNTNELTAIETFGLFNLSDYLPKEPNTEELEVIKEMFEASVDDQPYDPSKWEKYFKPYGLNSETETTSVATNNRKPAYTPTETKIVNTPNIEVDTSEEVSSIIANLRNKQKKTA